MAEYCRSIFGEALLIDPLDRYKVRNSCTCKERKWVKKKSFLKVFVSCTRPDLIPAGVGRTAAQSSGADGQNSHQEQEISQSLRRRRQEADRAAGQSGPRAPVA